MWTEVCANLEQRFIIAQCAFFAASLALPIYAAMKDMDMFHTNAKGTTQIGIFYCPAPTTLFTANTAPMGGEMNMTFDCCTDDGKEKLTTFVAFLKT